MTNADISLILTCDITYVWKGSDKTCNKILMIQQSKQKGSIINNEAEKSGRFCCQEVRFMKFEVSRLTFYKKEKFGWFWNGSIVLLLFNDKSHV